MQGLGQATAKLLLFGEHAAVYGYPALGMALRMHLRLTLSSADKKDSFGDNINLSEQKILLALLSKMRELFPSFKSCGSVHIAISSEIPIGVGFGSSGALSVAFVRAVLDLTHSKMDLQDLWVKAHELEKIMHGNPSGIDTGLSLFGGAQYFTCQKGSLPSLNPVSLGQLFFIVGATPRNSKTKSLIEGVKKKIDMGCERTKKVLSELGRASSLAQKLLGESQINHKELAYLASSANSYLNELGLVADLHKDIFQMAKSEGALGCKMSGGGGGGSFYIITEDFQSAREISDKIKRFFEKDLLFNQAFKIEKNQFVDN